MRGKLPIPRIEPERRVSVSRRVKRACEACRGHKRKCDGDRPVCSQCRTEGLNNCFYPERKAVRQQEALESKQREIDNYRALLKEISHGLEGSIADRVAKTLKGSPIQISEGMHHGQKPENPSPSFTPSNFTGTVDEDFNRSEKCRATGHIGVNSELTWMQQLHSQASKWENMEAISVNPQFQFPIDNSIASMNYHLDYQNISKPDMTTTFILPPKSLTDVLYQVYLEKVHTSFPVIRPDLFHDQLNRCYSEKTNPGRKWLAVFNTVLAIACALGRLSTHKLPDEADEDLFSARARALGIYGQFLFDHPDLQQVQAEALMAFHFLIKSQINRSWKLIGIAVSSSISLGFNIDERISIFDVKSREARKQLWWSIFRLENILSVMTGRVSCLGNASLSVSPPFLGSNLNLKLPDVAQPINQLQWTIHMDESQLDSQGMLLRSLVPTEPLYFFYMVDLSLIIHKVTNDMIATDYSQLGWDRLNTRILKFSETVDYWASTIHPSFGFQHSRIQNIPNRSPIQFSLALNYYSTRILLYRPCINDSAFEERRSSLESSSRFADERAFNCLCASLAVIALLPDQPDLTWIYQVPQWWDLLHILTQANVILLLGLTGPLPPALENAAKIFDPTVTNSVWASAKKGVSWLECLGETSEAARRAYHFLKSIMHRIIPNKDLRQENIPPRNDASRTSSNPKLPWLCAAYGTNQASACEETSAMDISGYSELAHSLSDSGKEAMRSHVPQEERYSIFPSASTVLDTEAKFPSPDSFTESPIEEVLFPILDFNA